MNSLRFTHLLVATINRLIIPPLLSARWVFSCFCNPPNSDVDYRIFNMWMWSFLCMCIHTGDGHTNSESAHFWLRKIHVFLCSRQGSNSGFSGHGILTPTLWDLPTEPPCHHNYQAIHHTELIPVQLRNESFTPDKLSVLITSHWTPTPEE